MHASWFPRAVGRRNDWTLPELDRLICRTPSDIRRHCPTLRRLAGACETVTEFGTRYGVSTTALLAGRPRRLVTYDVQRPPTLPLLKRIAGETDLRFIRADVLDVDIEPTDLLFIDTRHTYGQLKAELARHAGRVHRYLVIHDTRTFGRRGEDGGPGLRPAVEELLAEGEWELRLDSKADNGLIVLERRRFPNPSV